MEGRGGPTADINASHSITQVTEATVETRKGTKIALQNSYASVIKEKH